jgi:hypothetical protein
LKIEYLTLNIQRARIKKMNFSNVPKPLEKYGFVEKNGKPKKIRLFNVEYLHATNFRLPVILNVQNYSGTKKVAF